MIRAVVDESELTPTAGQAGLSAAFAGFAQLLQKLRVDRIDMYKHSTIWQAEVVSPFQLYEVLFIAGHIDNDVRELAYRELDRVPDCDEFGGVTHTNAKAFAKWSIDRGIPCALIVLPCRENRENLEDKDLVFIGTARSSLQYYRMAAEIGDFSPVDFVANGIRSFPNLHFAEHIAGQLGNFSLPIQSDTVPSNSGSRGFERLSAGLNFVEDAGSRN